MIHDTEGHANKQDKSKENAKDSVGASHGLIERSIRGNKPTQEKEDDSDPDCGNDLQAHR